MLFHFLTGLTISSLVTHLSYILIIVFSFTGVDSISLLVKSFLYVHGFIMMSSLFKGILKLQFSFHETGSIFMFLPCALDNKCKL